MNDSIAKLSYLAGTSGNTAIFMERRSAQTGEFKVARGKISQAAWKSRSRIFRLFTLRLILVRTTKPRCKRNIFRRVCVAAKREIAEPLPLVGVWVSTF